MINNKNNGINKAVDIQNESMGVSDTNWSARRTLFSKKEREEKDPVKKLFRYYAYLGFFQIEEKIDKHRKLYQLRNGKIDEREFANAKATYNAAIDRVSHAVNSKTGDVEFLPRNAHRDEQPDIEEVELEFFPLIPPAVDSIINNMDKNFTKQYVRAINPEAVNEIIDAQNKELQTNLVEAAQKLFEVDLVNLDDETKKQKEQVFMNSVKIQKYYKDEFRSEVEIWANHVLNIYEQKYQQKLLKRQLLEKIIVTDRPYMWVMFDNNDINFEPVDERNQFSLRSPLDKDASEYQMFGKFTYLTLNGLVGKYKLDEAQMEQLEKWSSIMSGQFYQTGRIMDFNQTHQEIATNNALFVKEQLYRAQKDLNGTGTGGDGHGYYDTSGDIPQNLIRETMITFKLPVKRGELTIKSNGALPFTEIVDEDYKVHVKPEYDLTWSREKTVENLVNGEHLEWFYETEVWTGIKLDISTRNLANNLITNDYSPIWIKIEPDKVQVKDPYHRFASILPVHGGSSTQMTDSMSLIEKAAPYQRLFSFLGNRLKNLLATEIGIFYAFNQATIPTSSANEEWSENSMIKYFQLAHDLGIAPQNLDINSISGQNQIAMGGGYGQVVDLSKSNDVAAKIALMEKIRQEFYMIIGVSPQTMGELSPYQSAQSVSQGLQRTSNLISHYYVRVEEIMAKANTTALYYAKYLQEKNPKELTYTNNDGARIVFKTMGKDFSLADLSIYVEHDQNDSERISLLKEDIRRNNTLPLNEMTAILFSDTSSEILDKLKEINLEQQQQEQQKQQAEMQKQQQVIDAQRANLKDTQAFEIQKLQMKLDSDEAVAREKSLGYANGTPTEIYNKLIDLKNLDLQDQKVQIEKQKTENQKNDSAAQRLHDKNMSDTNLINDKELQLLKIKQEKDKTQAENNRTRAMIAQKQKELNNKNN